VADDIGELARQYEVLSRELKALDERVRRIENIAGVPASAATLQAIQTEAGNNQKTQVNDNRTVSAEHPTAVLTLTGRTLIVLGGGYLLRMLTDNDILPNVAGVMAGLAYAFTWLLMAGRESQQNRHASGFAHGLAASLIAYPLIWETTARFKFVAPQNAALMLAVTTITAFVVAVRAGQASLAWTSSLCAVATAWSLLFKTGDILPFASGLFVLVIASEWLAHRELTPSVRWVPALALDGVILVMALLLSHTDGLPEHYAAFSGLGVISLGLMLVSTHLISTGVRTARLGQSLASFDVVQTALAIVIAFGTVGTLTTQSSTIHQASGACGVTLALACYALAFGVIRPRQGPRPTFFHFSSAAAALGLVGTYVLLGAQTASAVWLIVSPVVLWLGVKCDFITLRYHGTVYLIAGATGAGIIAGFGDGMLAGARANWQAPSFGPVMAFIFISLGYAVLLRSGRLDRTERQHVAWFELLPHFCVASLLGWTLACAAAGWTAMALAIAPSPQADAALLATVRTAVLASVAVICAWVGRRWVRRELTGLVWPTLLFGGLKLLLEDFGHGRPLTLFLALALYGGALVGVSGLLRHRSRVGG
jgi:hypothetical protein